MDHSDAKVQTTHQSSHESSHESSHQSSHQSSHLSIHSSTHHSIIGLREQATSASRQELFHPPSGLARNALGDAPPPAFHPEPRYNRSSPSRNACCLEVLKSAPKTRIVVKCSARFCMWARYAGPDTASGCPGKAGGVQ
jgi:hypothetical protein